MLNKRVNNENLHAVTSTKWRAQRWRQASAPAKKRDSTPVHHLGNKIIVENDLIILDNYRLLYAIIKTVLNWRYIYVIRIININRMITITMIIILRRQYPLLLLFGPQFFQKLTKGSHNFIIKIKSTLASWFWINIKDMNLWMLTIHITIWTQPFQRNFLFCRSS